MTQPSAASLITFLTLIAVLCTATLAAAERIDQRRITGERPDQWLRRTVLVLSVWLGVPAALAGFGVMRDFAGVPPPLMLVVIPMAVACVAIAASPIGARLVEAAGIGWLVGIQVFRLPLELLLHRLYVEGVVPVQMTYEGRNFDIVTGVLALVLGVWAMRAEPPRWAVWAFTAVGLVLLWNIVGVAILSTPMPIRQFFNEPANTFIGEFPWVWLPTFLVQAAWLLHLLALRWLLASPAPRISTSRLPA